MKNDRILLVSQHDELIQSMVLTFHPNQRPYNDSIVGFMSLEVIKRE
jgi:hypothetical protein